MPHSVGSMTWPNVLSWHPKQVNARGGRIIAPLPAALCKRHFHVANLLYAHGAVVDVQDSLKRTPLYTASASGQVDIMRWLLDHVADANARISAGLIWTPLHYATCNTHLEGVQVLLEHRADINSQDSRGETPLCVVLTGRSYTPEEKVVGIVRRLLEHGADPNICNHSHSTALHLALFRGWLEVTRLLLNYGANVDEKDGNGRTPFQLSASKGHHEITKLLFARGAVPQPLHYPLTF